VQEPWLSGLSYRRFGAVKDMHGGDDARGDHQNGGASYACFIVVCMSGDDVLMVACLLFCHVLVVR
jgi:hypothetical protein